MADKFTLIFVEERSTKRTMRFQEQEERLAGPVVTTLYVQKDALAELGNPSRLRVTIEPDYE